MLAWQTAKPVADGRCPSCGYRYNSLGHTVSCVLLRPGGSS